MGELIVHHGDEGIELHGYLVRASSDTLLIHYHGLAGNFYENRFIHEFVEESPSFGMSFMTVNTRAHDYISDAFLSASQTFLRRGAAHTSLKEVTSDLDAWLRFAASAGFKRVIVQGHSTGAVGWARMLLTENRPLIGGAVFASPSDMIGLQVATHGAGESEGYLRTAQSLVSEKRGETLMPEAALEDYMIDARTYAEMFLPDGEWDIFRFDDPRRLGRLREIRVPMFMLFGDTNEACPVSPADALATTMTTVGAERLQTLLLEGASHSYRGHEAAVTKEVLTWARSVLGTR